MSDKNNSNNNTIIARISTKLTKHAALHGKQAWLEIKHQVPTTWNHYSKQAEANAETNNSTFDPSNV